MMRLATTLITFACAGGCLGHAETELSAAQLLDALADEFRQSAEECRRDLALMDDQRELSAVNAFLERIDNRVGEDRSRPQDREALHEALAKIRQDRAVALKRYVTTMDNLDLLTEVSAGLKRLGLKQLELNYQTERYVQEIIDRTISRTTKE